MTVMEKAPVKLDDDEQEEAARVAYARAVGSRLRAMRKQMRLSLQAVEAMSDQEFKASVLGAYERGGQWRRALGAFRQAQAQGCEPDAILYGALLDALWDTGAVWGCPGYGVFRV